MHDGAWLPSALSRGPWDERAQHGGAAGALLAHVAESELPDHSWTLSRMSMELVKPVPVAPLHSRTALHPGRSTMRMTVDLLSGEVLVARAHMLAVRGQGFTLPDGVPGWSPDRLLPGPASCSEPAVIPGMPHGTSFYYNAVEHRMAGGNIARPGPGAAWFRLRVPIIDGATTTPFMLAAAVADSGSGISWVLPPETYLFANADLSLHLHRAPAGEWLGMESESQVDGGGAGTTLSRLYDVDGPVGVAVQTLVVRERR
ncbi:thioesterase family protein [Arthrobacter stackebrandtii]|nr:thioesterase family protein [Arthrobacter stackebrandtii]PYH01880.1 thioesterase family protein [Arthrobacter stackebrandtii]